MKMWKFYLYSEVPGEKLPLGVTTPKTTSLEKKSFTFPCNWDPTPKTTNSYFVDFIGVPLCYMLCVCCCFFAFP